MYFELLNQMLHDMGSAAPLYQPTNYWRQLIPFIVEDIKFFGFENFRDTDTFIHIWGNVGGLREFKNQYEVFKSHNDHNKPPNFDEFSESLVGCPCQYLQFDGRFFTMTSLNYLRGLAFLKKHVDTSKIQRVLEIGGGYGCLGEIFLKSKPGPYFYVNIDIPPVAALSTFYLQSVFGKDKILDYSQSKDLPQLDVDELSQTYRGMVLCPWQLPKLKGNFQLAANFISFQEMEPEVVQNYLSFISTLVTDYVLLRNSRYGKPKSNQPGQAGVLKPVMRQDYLDGLKLFELISLDSRTFGWANNLGFESEVMVLKRK